MTGEIVGGLVGIGIAIGIVWILCHLVMWWFGSPLPKYPEPPPLPGHPRPCTHGPCSPCVGHTTEAQS